MSELSVFSFSEKLPVRVAEFNGEPWFVARDVATCLEYSKSTINSIAKLIEPVPDQWKAIQEFNTAGGKQKLLSISEQGLYFFLGRSDKPKALPFQMWLAGEVLPAIRRTGRYECPAQPQYLTDQQCWAIQSAVGKRARGQGAHFQTIYRALKARFQVPTYTRILSKDFEAAIEFIQTCELRAPVRQETAPQLTKQDDLCPHCGLRPIPHDSIVLSSSEAESLLTFIYYVRFLFRDANDLVYQLLRAVNSPMAGKFWDALHEVNWGRMLDTLARHGHDIRDMKCYQHFISDRA